MTTRHGWTLLGLALALNAPSAWADYDVTGVFQYEDRPLNQTGFTGAIVLNPIRGADVQVVDVGTAPVTILAEGSTDTQGSFLLHVADTQIRTIAVRCLTTSTHSPELFQQRVMAYTGNAPYAVSSPAYADHAPTAPIDFTASPVVGGRDNVGGPFHIFDWAETVENYVQQLTSQMPRYPMTVYWEAGKDWGKYYDIAGGVHLNGDADRDEYDDSIILHEMGHYVALNYSKDAGFYGAHGLNWLLDIRLAFTEGIASYFMGAVRRFVNDPNGMMYIETNGTTLSWYGMADPNNRDAATSYYTWAPTPSAANEVNVAHAAYDVVDTRDTNDGTPGVDDDDMGLLGLDGDRLVWNVLTDIDAHVNALPKQVSMETFWDAWLAHPNPYADAFNHIGDHLGIKYHQDDFEPDDNAASARLLDLSGQPLTEPHTYYGTSDEDWLTFQGLTDYYYVFETRNLYDGADPMLTLLAGDGATPLAANDDKDGSHKEARVTWLPQAAGTYYVQSKRVIESPQPIGQYGYCDLTAERIAKPVVSNVTPAQGDTHGGTVVTVSGAHFASGAQLYVGVYEAVNVSVVNDGTITATTPANVPGGSLVRVVNPVIDGVTPEGQREHAFTYTGPALAPQLHTLSRDSGSLRAGTVITLHGDYFMAGAAVSFGSAQATDITLLDAQRITARVPTDAAAVVDMHVVNPDGQQALLAGAFEITRWYGVAIASTIPASTAPVRQTVMITEDFSPSDLYVYLEYTKHLANDVTVTLTSPLGTTVTVYDGALDVTADGTAWRSAITSFFGLDEPPAELLRLVADEPARGAWTLTVTNRNPDAGGTLRAWGLEFFQYRRPQTHATLLTACQYRNYIAAVDPVTHQLLYRVRLGGYYPNDVVMAADLSKAYAITTEVGNQSMLTEFEPLTGRRTAEWQVPGVPWFIPSLALTPDGARLVIATSERVHVVDTATHQLSATLLEAELLGDGVTTIAMAPDGTKAYVVSDRADGVIWVINLRNLSVSKTIHGIRRPNGVAFTPDGLKAYVVQWDTGACTVINAVTDEVEDSFPTASWGSYIQISPDGAMAYHGKYQWYAGFGRIDLAARSSAIMDPAEDPSATTSSVAFSRNPATHHTTAYIADWGQGRIMAVDPATDARLANIPLNRLNNYNSYPMGMVASDEVIYLSLLPLGARPIHAGHELVVPVKASYNGNQPLTYAAQPLPTGATFDGRLFRWTPSAAQAGPYAVSVSVTDGAHTDAKSLTMTVIINHPPALYPIEDRSVAVTPWSHPTVQFTVTGSDPDGDPLTYSATHLPAGATFVGQTFTWTPTDVRQEPQQVTFTVSDGELSDERVVTITVVTLPTAPANLVATGVASQHISLTWQDLSDDEDGFTVRRELAGHYPIDIAQLPANATSYEDHDPALVPGQFYYYQIRADNLAGSTYSNHAGLYVPANRTPTLDPIGPRTGAEASLLRWVVSGSGPDGAALTFTATDLPAGASFDAGSRTFSWTPDYTQAGSYQVTFSVSDGAVSDEETVTITITQSPPPAPSQLQARAISEDTIKVMLTWQDHSPNEEEFRIERSLHGSTFTHVATVPANSTTYTDAGLAPETTYDYRIQAVEAASGASGYANTATVTTTKLMPYVISCTPTSGKKHTQVTITGMYFGVKQSTSRVEFSGNGVAKNASLVKWNTANIVCKVPLLSPGTYTVKVCNQNGASNTTTFIVIP